VHRGVVEAAALLVDEDLAGPLGARRRVLTAWAPGATVHRLGAALLVRFALPRRIDCARAPGLPLSATSAEPGAPIASAPLDEDEVAAIAAARGSAILVREGAVLAVSPADADLEDPATYLDLDAFDAVPVAPLGPAPARPLIVAAPVNRPARDIFGVSPPAPELASVMAALAAARGKDGAAAAAAEHDATAGGRVTALLARFAALLATLASLVARVGARIGSGARPDRAPAGEPRSSRTELVLATGPRRPDGPTLADRVAARLHDWMVSLVARARLAPLIGRRQAEYLGRMVDMFDRGDFSEALRHAIPLGDGKGEGPALGGGPALGLPTPRTGLAISVGNAGVSTSIFAGDDFYAELRKKYRAAFERLEREGRIDEAAFVLAELLRADEEAVAFLERHGRLRLAAELAEARNMPPGLLVRQWFLAGERDRALRIARRTGAFADAVTRLEKTDVASAQQLRILWAESLATAGDYEAAVGVIWPIVEARRLGAAWIDAVLEQGGLAAARMLVRKLELMPESFPDVRARVLALLDDTGPGSSAERRALAEAFLAGAPTSRTRTLARATVRALVRDGARSGELSTTALVAKLAAFAADDALRADLPSWPAVERTRLTAVPVARAFDFAAADAGAIPVSDAVYLPNGRVVAALGEAGVRVLGRDGRTLFHLDQPAHRLVISDHGDRAIALARRGDVWRLSRLDLLGRRTEVWCEAAIDVFAADFDGTAWAVASGDTLLVIDAAAPRFEAFASFPLRERVAAIGRSATSCALITMGTGKNVHLSRVRFDLPGWTMRTQKKIDGPTLAPAETAFGPAITALGAATICSTRSPPLGGLEEKPVMMLHARDGADPPRFELAGGPGLPIAADARPGWVAWALRSWDPRPQGAAVRVHLLDEGRLEARAQVTLAGATQASVRLGDESLTVTDDRGRVLVFELFHGSLIRSLRLV
jgi:hypothetical protein